MLLRILHCQGQIQGNGHSHKTMQVLYHHLYSTNIYLSHLAFMQDQPNVFFGTTLTSTCVIKLHSEDRLLIHSNITNNPGHDDVLVSINSTTSIN